MTPGRARRRDQAHPDMRRKSPATRAPRGTATSAAPPRRQYEPGAPLDATLLLELQRTVGNRSVTQLIEGKVQAPTLTLPRERGREFLQRKPAVAAPPKPKVEAKWKGEEGENSGASMVGEIQRVPLQGLPSGRALVLVPSSLGASPAAVEVLIHLHGFGIGYRKLTKGMIAESRKKGSLYRTAGMSEGQVRDTAIDKTEAQLQASGRPMVAILPQASALQSEFGAFTSDSYIHEVFKGLVEVGVWKAGKTSDGLPVVNGTVLSGHSGAGKTLAPMMGASARLPSGLKEVTLFDAINSGDQLKAVVKWVTGQLTKEYRDLLAAPTKVERTAYLDKSMRFFGYYTHNWIYPAMYAKLRAAIDTWFANHGTALDVLGVRSALRANYDVIDAGDIEHEDVMGKKERFKESLGKLGPAFAPEKPPAHTAADETAASATGATMALKLSGIHWVAQFPGSKTTDTLKAGFKEHVEAFIALLEKNGANVEITATYRPPERAFLMNRAGQIMVGQLKPSEADDSLNTGIVWDHGNDAKSRAAATEMCSKAGYDIAYPAHYPSRHMYHAAIDMTITGLPKKITGLPGKKKADIGTEPAESNHKLWDIGAKYYKVYKLAVDRPHWSDNGH